MDARDDWNILSSAPFVIFERAAAGFKRVIYVVSNILSRDWMKDCNKFTHISNPVDIHSVCRELDEEILIIKLRTERDKSPKKWSLEFDLTKIKMFTVEDKQ